LRLIAEAAAILGRGGLVAFPTETVYGLGADASNDTAVAKIYRVKGRPAGHPVIVHIDAAGKLQHWARDIPESAQKLAQRFWPGPLTLVLKRSEAVHDCVTGGQDTIGLRVPGHPLALELLRAFGGGIAAPSANKSGRISPTTADHVRRDLGDEVDLVLDGGACEVGIESTIIDVSAGRPVLLRPGSIRAEVIAAVIGIAPEPRHAGSPRAPGSLESHYAPQRPLRLASREELRRAVAESGPEYAVLALTEVPPEVRTALWIRGSASPVRYAHELYANLRLLDASGAGVILVERPPEGPDWTAISDRLSRAASA
jgi:L-threonylcarbamoyladenylate synthase